MTNFSCPPPFTRKWVWRRERWKETAENCNKSEFRRPPVIKLRSLFLPSNFSNSSHLLKFFSLSLLEKLSGKISIYLNFFHHTIFTSQDNLCRETRQKENFFFSLHAQSSHVLKMTKSEAIMLQHKSCVCIIRLRH